MGPAERGSAVVAGHRTAVVAGRRTAVVAGRRTAVAREGVVAYFEAFRPQLVGSEVAQTMMQFLVNLGQHVLPQNTPAVVRRLLNIPLRHAIVATMPPWMRRLGGLHQSRVATLSARLLTKPVWRFLAARPRLEVTTLELLTPLTRPILGPALLDMAPSDPTVYTPAQARQKFGFEQTPIEQYAAIKQNRPAPYVKNHHDALIAFDSTE